MARKKLGYTKLIWSCPSCATRNPGPNRFCNGCGAPMPEDIRFEQPEEAELITDAAELAHAKAGPDRHCPYCRARNRGDATFCGACGGDLSKGEARQAGQVVGAFRADSGATRPCPACGTPNKLTALRCTNCGSALPSAPAAAESEPPTARTPGRGLPRILIGGLLALACLGGLALVLLGARRQDRLATVASLHWERQLAVEAFGPVERTDWESDLPPAARQVACELAYYDTSDEPAPVATEVCGTPYTLDTGGGFAEVVQDCSYRVYEPRCSYTIDEWSVVETRRLEGDGGTPRWPVVSASAGERAGEQTETLTVILESDGETLTYLAAGEADFSRFTVGSRWQVTVSGLGRIVGIAPAP